MKKRILFIVLATLCLFSEVDAQFYKPSDKTIRMGETLPESFYKASHQAVNAKTRQPVTIQLQQYRDKLIILDFWATWCGPCILSLNKLDSTKSAMGNNEFIVVPVTYQNAAEAMPAFKKFKWNMTSIVADTILAQIFPHNGIPHQVWIRNGKVIAIPQWTYAIADNILKTLKGQQAAMRMNIQDTKVEPYQPLQMIGKQKKDDILFQSMITREVPGAVKLPLQQKITDQLTVLTMINQTVTGLLYQAYKLEILPELSSTEDSGVLLLISDSLRNRLKKPKINLKGDLKSDVPLLSWQKENLYSYQLYSACRLNSKDAHQIMQQDLNRYMMSRLGIEAKMIHKELRVAILKVKDTRSKTMELLKNKGKNWKAETTKTDYNMNDVGFRAIVALVKKISPGTVPLNRTGIPLEFAIDFSISRIIDNNPAAARAELVKYGIDLKIETRQVPVLMIREKGYNKPILKKL